jgi:methenyltetrahydromethanopterin cyclohydrolase
MSLSVNKRALHLVEEMIENREELKVKVEETPEGATLIDAGVDAEGGYLAGKWVTEVTLGGLGKAFLSNVSYRDFHLPAINVATDHPGIALFGSQFAGWRVKVGKYFAMGSGPARAISLKPKDLYAKIGYRDDSGVAVIVLETSKKPGEEVIAYIAEECNITPDRLYVLLTPTSSIAGSTQISGRIVETGLHKLTEVGLDPSKVLSGFGYAPIAPVHPKSHRAMGRTNDMLLYGGVACFNVDWDDDEGLRRIVLEVPSSRSRDYGRPFSEVFKAAGYDFYKIDPSLFAPAVVMVNNVETGSFFKAGRVNEEVIWQSITS